MNAAITVHRARPIIWARPLLIVLSVLLLSAIIGYLGISAYVVDKFSMPERHPISQTPAEYGLAYETVRFNSAADRIPLEGWYIDSPGSQVILMLHGRNGNRESGYAAMPLMQTLVAHNYDVFMFDFRGHGNSGAGRLSFGQFEKRDVTGALEYLKTRGVNEVGVIGFSLGAITAVDAAPEHPEMRAIVVDSVFADMPPFVEYNLARLAGLPSIFTPGVAATGRVLYGLDIPGNRPARALASLGSRPVLLIHGTQDQDIPVANAYLLQKAAANNSNFKLWIVEGSAHTMAYPDHPEEFEQRMLNFYDRYLGHD